MTTARRPQRARGVLLRIAYDGTLFHGVARQDNARTVSGELLGAIYEMDPRATSLRVASRTDKGVHAHCQYVSFETDKVIGSRGWVLGLSRKLPAEISVLGATQICAGLEPSILAKRKTYRYFVLVSELRDPFWNNRAWRIPNRLNHELMADEARTLLGEHDFAAFRGAQDERPETVRTVLRAEVQNLPSDPRVLVIEVEGNRFLYKMMRIIAGTLVDIGRGRLKPGAVGRGLTSLNRDDLGMTAPPGGLYLQHIELEQVGHDTWPESPMERFHQLP